MKIYIHDFDEPDRTLKLKIIKVIVILAFLVVGVRLFSLQVQHRERYSKVSTLNKLRKIYVPAARGFIFDRDGKLLADNRRSYNLNLYPDSASISTKELIMAISQLSGIKYEEIEARIKREKKSGAPFMPLTVLEDMDRNLMAAIQENLMILDGMEVDVVPRRWYAGDKSISHWLGYVGEINKDELRRFSRKQGAKNYRPGNYVGKTGIEKIMEEYLRGVEGSYYKVVDASGRPNVVFEEELGLPEPIPSRPGKNVHLSIDMDLQFAAYMAMQDKVGALAAIDPRNGDVLAMVSSPGFDLNAFARGLKTEEWDELRNNDLHPMENRVIRGQYPPASIFKIVVAAAALEEKIITPETEVRCEGKIELGGNTFRCWNRVGHGDMNVTQAIIQSCDVFFYEIGVQVGIDKIAEYAKKFGLAEKTGIELPGEAKGLIPTKAWKAKRFGGQIWYTGETILASIGQGYVLVTPLQALAMVSAVAGNGVRYKPRLIMKITDSEGRTIKSFPPVIAMEKIISKRTHAILNKALIGVVHDEKGTAAKYGKLDPPLEQERVAFKTGTAQVIRLQSNLAKFKDGVPWKFRDHAWIVGYAPAINPEIAVVVLSEHGGSGGKEAGPIAKKVIQAFLEKKHPKLTDTHRKDDIE